MTPSFDLDLSPQSNNESRPSIIITLLLGIQAIFLHILLLLYEPLLLLPVLCLLPDDPIRGKLLCLTLFFSATTTILQSLFGVKLPVISTPSNIYIMTIFLVLGHEKWICPSEELHGKMGSTLTEEQFNIRLNEVRGMCLILIILQLLLYFSGFIDFVERFMSYSTITSLLISTSLSNLKRSSTCRITGLSFLTLFCLLLLLCFQKVALPLPKLRRGEIWETYSTKVFKLFPVLAVIFGWLIYLQGFDIIPDRDDVLTRTLATMNWFPISMFSIYGLPTFSWRLCFYSIIVVLFQNFMTISYISTYSKLTGKEGGAIVVKNGFKVELLIGIISSFFGIPISVISNPNMIGIMSLTNVKTKETSIIAGACLLLISLLFKPLVIFSFIPVQMLHIFNILIQGMVLYTGFLMFAKLSTRECFVTTLSLVTGLIIPEWLSQLDVLELSHNSEATILISTFTCFSISLFMPIQ